MKITRIKNKISVNETFLLLSVAILTALMFGYSVAMQSIFLVFISLFLYFIFFIRLTRCSLRKIFFISVIYNFFTGFALTGWFTKITTTGWFDSIGLLNIKVWLVIFLFITALVAALPLAIVNLLFAQIAKKFKLSSNKINTFLLFALMMTSVEISRQYLFALIVKSNGTPVEPVWGIFSVTSALPNFLLISKVPALLGYWGTSYFIFLCGATIGGIILTLFSSHKRTKIINYLDSIILLAMVGGIVLASSYSVKQSGSPAGTQKIHVIATSTDSKKDYIKKLKNALTDRDGSIYTIVVLPEYDKIIHPAKNTPSILVNSERTDDLFSANQNNVFYVGTEDDSWGLKRYALNFLGDKDTYLIRKSKKFLIPGGEYVVGWVNKILSPFDSLATLEFTKSRGRYVINSNEISKITKKHVLQDVVSIGACSSVLSPYVFREDVANGAQFIALNLSFAQFKQAPEYEQFAKNYMIFMANAYQRPVAAGVQDGQALFISPYDNNGLIQQDIITADIPFNAHKTLYTKLGDFWILTILGVITAASIILPNALTRKKTLDKKNKGHDK